MTDRDAQRLQGDLDELRFKLRSIDRLVPGEGEVVSRVRQQLAERDATIARLRAELSQFTEIHPPTVQRIAELTAELAENRRMHDIRDGVEAISNRRVEELTAERDAACKHGGDAIGRLVIVGEERDAAMAALDKANTEHQQYRALVVEEFADYERTITKAKALADRAREVWGNTQLYDEAQLAAWDTERAELDK